MSPEEALKTLSGAEDWGTLRAMVMGLNVDLHCLQSAELKSLKDIPQHYVDKKYNALHSN